MADSEEADLRNWLRQLEERRGALHIETTAVRNDLAQYLHNAGRLAESEAQYTTTCEGLARHFGSAHLFTLTCLNNLAIVLRDRGRTQEALNILTTVHQSREQQLGPVHPLTLNAAMSVLDLLVDSAEFETGLARFRELLATCEAHLGPQAEHTVVVRDRLAAALRRAGRHEEAARLVGPPEVRAVGRVLLGCARELRYAGLCPVSMVASRYGAELVLGFHDRARARLVPGEQVHDAESGVQVRVVSPDSLARPYGPDSDWMPVADRLADAVGALAEHFLAAGQRLGHDRLRVQVRLCHQYWPLISTAPALAVDRRAMSHGARAQHDQLVRTDFPGMDMGRTGFTGYLAEGILVSSIHGVEGTARPSQYEV